MLLGVFHGHLAVCEALLGAPGDPPILPYKDPDEESEKDADEGKEHTEVEEQEEKVEEDVHVIEGDEENNDEAENQLQDGGDDDLGAIDPSLQNGEDKDEGDSDEEEEETPVGLYPLERMQLATRKIMLERRFVQTAVAAVNEGHVRLLKLAAENRDVSLNEPPRPLSKDILAAKDFDGRTPLQLAAHLRERGIAVLLLQNAADVNIGDAQGNNALMEAAMNADRELVECLLVAKPILTAKNTAGKRAVDLTEDRVIREMLEKVVAYSKINPRLLAIQAEPKKGDASQDAVIFRVRVEQLPRHLDADTLTKHIRTLVCDLGADKPLHVAVCLDPISGRPRGFAYVDFRDAGSAGQAMKGDGQDLCGSIIRTFRDLPAAMVR